MCHAQGAVITGGEYVVNPASAKHQASQASLSATRKYANRAFNCRSIDHVAGPLLSSNSVKGSRANLASRRLVNARADFGDRRCRDVGVGTGNQGRSLHV